MSGQTTRANRWLAVLVVASLLFTVGALVLRIGLDATPYETTNTAGRAMGFNDRLGFEHYLILAGNFDPGKLFELKYAYEWLLLLAHGIGLWLLLSPDHSGKLSTRWFFAMQVLVFPFGLPCLCIMFPMVFGLLSGGLDRESFVDIPFFLVSAQPVWALTSVFVMLAWDGPSLGLSKFTFACRQALRAGRQKFTEAMR